MAGVLSLKTPSTGLVTLTPTDTATDKTITLPATTGTVVIQDGTSTATVTNLAYTGTLTGGTGVVNLGSGQVYKDASGNVGIGTSSPQAALHVAGAIGGSPTGSGVLAGIQSDYAIIHLNGSAATGGIVDFSVSGTDSKGRIQYSNVDNFMYFGTNSSERVRIDSSGNVGIGTSSPTSKLSVNGVIDQISQGTASAQIRAVNTGGTFYHGIDTSTGASFGSAYAAVLWHSGAYPMIFATSNAEKMRIDSSGNLLVGATTYAGAGLSLSSPSGSGSYSVIAAGGTGFHWRFGNVSNGLVGSISSTTTATSFTTSSDYRLKENVAPMQNALVTVAALKPCTYTWKADGSAGQGFIAHELQEVVPDCVTGEKDALDADGNPKYQGVDTSFLVATLTAAIQEQQALIQSLTTRLTALEGN